MSKRVDRMDFIDFLDCLYAELIDDECEHGVPFLECKVCETLDAMDEAEQLLGYRGHA